MLLLSGICCELGLVSAAVLFFHASKGISQIAQAKAGIRARQAVLERQARTNDLEAPEVQRLALQRCMNSQIHCLHTWCCCSLPIIKDMCSMLHAFVGSQKAIVVNKTLISRCSCVSSIVNVYNLRLLNTIYFF